MCYLAKFSPLQNADFVAVKWLKLLNSKDVPGVKEFLKEVKISYVLDHPNIVRTFGGIADQKSNTFAIVGKIEKLACLRGANS